MNIVQATRDYERWLNQHTPLVSAEVRSKHLAMSADLFSFLQATFYRWVQIWPEVCPDLSRAPKVLAVGDLHVENFGTWRDIEGRLVWGINDFDETFHFAYTIDLVRLTTSALLATEAEALGLDARVSAEAILDGYMEGLRAGGRPILLGEKNKRLWEMAQGELRAPALFWRKMDALKKLRKVPLEVRRAILPLLQDPKTSLVFAHRVAGFGSLGRHRYVALGTWRGGRIAREAKPLAPSAAVWAGHEDKGTAILYQRILNQAVRCVDPFVHMEGNWIVRRLSPDCSRIEMSALPVKRDERRLLYSMGWETANVHLGTPGTRGRILADLKKRDARWFLKAARKMAKAVTSDWKDWRERR